MASILSRPAFRDLLKALLETWESLNELPHHLRSMVDSTAEFQSPGTDIILGLKKMTGLVWKLCVFSVAAVGHLQELPHRGSRKMRYRPGRKQRSWRLVRDSLGPWGL